MMVNYEEDQNRQSNCHLFLCLSVACCAINVFNLDQTGEVKPNLIAINHRQQVCKRRKKKKWFYYGVLSQEKQSETLDTPYLYKTTSNPSTKSHII